MKRDLQAAVVDERLVGRIYRQQVQGDIKWLWLPKTVPAPPRPWVANRCHIGLSAIPGNHRSGLHVRQKPIPISVSDPRRRRGQPIEVDFAVLD
jgi:hypothetical protein